MKEFADCGQNYDQKVYISHSNCIEDAIAVKNLVEESFPFTRGKIVVNYIGSTIGCHSGPGTVALFFFGSKRDN